MAGVPARRIGWSGKSGARLLPEAGQTHVFRCPETGSRYHLLDERTLMPEDEISDSAEDPEPELPVPLLDLKGAVSRDRAGDRLSRCGGWSNRRVSSWGAEVQAFEEEAAQAIGRAARHRLRLGGAMRCCWR